jgi:hypothetical protein
MFLILHLGTGLLIALQSSKSTVCSASSIFLEPGAARQLIALLALAPTCLGRLLSAFFALRWCQICSGLCAASAANGPQCALFYSRQSFHMEIVMLIGKHINRFVLPFVLDFVSNEVEHEVR